MNFFKPNIIYVMAAIVVVVAVMVLFAEPVFSQHPTTQIRYELPRQSDVRLEVFDMTGRQVAVLVNGNVSAGTHTVNFDATNLSSGVYMYRLQAGNVLLSRKLTVIK